MGTEQCQLDPLAAMAANGMVLAPSSAPTAQPFGPEWIAAYFAEVDRMDPDELLRWYVLFEREPDTPNAGWITNVISDHGDDLILTFTFAVRFPGVAESSDDERAQGEAMRAGYLAAVTTTLDTVRRRARERPPTHPRGEPPLVGGVGGGHDAEVCDRLTVTIDQGGPA